MSERRRAAASLSVVVAPDSFKGSLGAAGVAAAIAAGWSSVRPGDTIRLLPQADGGEGTLETIEAAVPGSVRHEIGPVTGPDGRPTPGVWLELPDGTAVVELAQMSGLPLMDRPDPLGATTFGLGEVIRSAVTAGVRRLLVGLGGSASTDGGAGALAALGLRLADGSDLPPGGAALADLTGLDRSGLLAPPPDGVVLLTDVSAPLLGPGGAAAVFAPQKGADRAQVGLLEAALARFATLLGDGASIPGSGAAGGAGYGFLAAWGARVEPGAGYLATITGLDEAIVSSDLLLTGEGRFDATSTGGKLVGELIRMAGDRHVRLGLVAGQIAARPVAPDGTEPWSVALSDLAGSVDSAVGEPARWLFEAGRRAARELPRDAQAAVPKMGT
ncbi:MAG TPA: glycerate kinase [Lacisediminihabitans sp.]|uniref:glycerate kinase family protein n=1 Tax=Lacisediminihabitans sp. TaxID=2787631 RepID=UPI002EDA4315